MSGRRTILRGVVWALAAAVAISFCACAPSGGGTTGATSNEGPTKSGAPAATAPSATGEFVWASDSDCGICHESEATSFETTMAQHNALEGMCISCHSDQQGLQAAHESVTWDSSKKASKLKKTQVAEDACLSCHDKQELAAKTAGSTVLTDKNGTTANPHDLPQNADHTNADLACATCHKLHGEDPIEQTALKACIDCHHAEVFECGTCHD